MQSNFKTFDYGNLQRDQLKDLPKNSIFGKLKQKYDMSIEKQRKTTLNERELISLKQDFLRSGPVNTHSTVNTESDGNQNSQIDFFVSPEKPGKSRNAKPQTQSLLFIPKVKKTATSSFYKDRK